MYNYNYITGCYQGHFSPNFPSYVSSAERSHFKDDCSLEQL